MGLEVSWQHRPCCELLLRLYTRSRFILKHASACSWYQQCSLYSRAWTLPEAFFLESDLVVCITNAQKPRTARRDNL